MAPHSGNLLAVLLALSSAMVFFTATLCTPEEVDQENFRKLAKANNDLALKLYHRLTYNSSQNIFFSPMSLSIVFGMLYYGTEGQTAKELRGVLGYDTADLSDELIHQTFKKFLTESLPSLDPSAYVIKAANGILLDKHLNLVPSYRNTVQDIYQASVQDVDFSNEEHQVVRKVNTWVKEKTSGKIKKLLDELDPTTSFVLLNAVYFKGIWKKKFKAKQTRRQIFYNNGVEDMCKKVPMMRTTEDFPYASAYDAQIIELPYKGENISMMIFLPNSRDGLETLEKDLTMEKLFAITKQLNKTKVHLTLPKFKIKYLKEMSGDFQNLGANGMFQPGANFSGLATDENLYVSLILHKAFLKVNEEGSEAAAITGVVVQGRSRKKNFAPRFIADHPFIFAIVDKRSFMVLFLGSVKNL